MAEKTFAAFFSYVHDDDSHDNGRITKLRQMLEQEVQALSGEDFEIFQDYDDIHWGQKWEERLNGALDGSTFLISIVTPRYLRKEFCRKEVLRFLGREKQLDRNDLVLSIYYIDTELSDTNDPVVSAISGHQYFDWRDLRHELYTNPEVGKRIEKMAQEIITAIRRSVPFSTKTPSTIEKTVISDLSVSQVPESTTHVEPRQPTKRIEPLTVTVNPMPRRADYTTITKAIESAEPGTRILIYPGLYKEAIVLDKPIELIGEGERDEIVIEASGANILKFNTEFGRVANLTLRQVGGGEFSGVNISQGRLEVEDCDITSQSLACVAIHHGADPRLRRNRIHDGKRSGIYIYENGKGTLEDNEIFGHKYRGVTIESSGDPTFRRNRIHRNAVGVLISKNGKGTFEDNEIFGNLEAGILVTTDGDPILRRNRIHDEKQYGVLVDENGKGIFEENDIFSNTYAGVSITTGGDPILRRNRIYNGLQDGVLICIKGKGTLENNEITGNAYSGVEITEGSSPILRHNIVRENGDNAIWIHDNGGGIFEDNDLRNNKIGAWNIDDSSRPNSSGSGNIDE